MERQYLVERILADMRVHPDEYNSAKMRFLFCVQQAPEAILEGDDYKGRFLREGYFMTFDDLYRGGIIPADVPELRNAVFKNDFEVPQLKMDDLREQEMGRTDVYFLGLTCCGHSSMLAGVIKYLHDFGRGVYVPHRNKEGIDMCVPYCNAVLRGLDECKLPQSTCRETMSFLQFNLGDDFDRKVTFVEYGDGAIGRLANAITDDPEVWDRESLGRCLRNDNPKTLFFVVSYQMISKHKPVSEPHQAEILENALVAMDCNGEGKKGEKNCTMSKVQTVAIVFSHSDLMDEEAGRPLNKVERRKIAMDYLDSRLRSFMNNLCDMCKKYGINKDNQNKPYVFTHSLGKFYVGNSVVYDPTDSNCLSEFLISTTTQKKKFAFI